ncbi:MAG: hypothetical protein GY708_01670 [Actinomycetia bacterium]|nr:hypothetical protein [Actinomycetes bacterium]MCP4960952.1 hypothetical protein [Actinomycetes bacterium]
MNTTAQQLVSDYGIEAETAELLVEYGFDREMFDSLRSRLAGGGVDPSRNIVTGRVEVPPSSALLRFPASGTDERERLAAIGDDAINAGQVAVVLLAGGMATRFGGGVKALAEVLPGIRFVDTKIRDLEVAGRNSATPVSMVLMTSFQSDPVLSEVAAGFSSEKVAIETAPQNVAMRVTAEGELFKRDDGSVSPYAPGHGDLGDAVRNSGFLGRFIASGGRYLFVTNVDNAAATLDPAMIGLHIDTGNAMTCEVVSADQGATGGAPYLVDGHLQILEAFRVPPAVADIQIPAVNTNSLVIDAERLTEPHNLTWFEVEKKVDELPVVQFERLVGELSAFVPTTMVVVERDGVEGRFQPVKDPAELERRRPDIKEILEHRGIL